jgi:hypothetical protein
MSRLVLMELLFNWCRFRTAPQSRRLLGCDPEKRVHRLPRRNLGILSGGEVQCWGRHVAPCIDRVELGVDRQLSGSWCSYGKRLPDTDRRLQSPAFGQVGGIPSIPLRRLRSFCLYGVGGLVQWLRKPMPREQKYSGADSPRDSPSRV